MTVILSMLAGAAIGVGVALVLYVLGFAVELLSCACQIVSCDTTGNSAIPGMWEGSSFLSVLLVCTIAGAIIGLIYGIYKTKVACDEKNRIRDAANSEEAKKQRIKLAGEIKQKALNVANICGNNVREYKALISPTYKADAQMDIIINELANVTELHGKVNAMAEDAKTKGYISK